ncbi:hypothetical protein BJ741DRAFT_699369 [Chytriomyces cf. hyalinus JEL632]|nr:hypothetical protein BJ741DRAFT_699369 [Chytriomyces cf. hyalinus JEL632]
MNTSFEADDLLRLNVSRGTKQSSITNVPLKANIVSEIRDMGHCYENGKGIPQTITNTEQACNKITPKHPHEYLEPAAKQKQKEAICALGLLVGEGLGSAKDSVRAAKLYQQPAASGDGLGAYNLGVVFESGQGVPADLNIALDYYKQAVRLKCHLAKPSLQPTSYFMNLLHSVGTLYALSGNDAVSFDADMRHYTPPQTPDTTLSILPVELTTLIFQFPHPKQCIQLRSTSHRMLTVIDNDSFARHLFQFNALFLPS